MQKRYSKYKHTFITKITVVIFVIFFAFSNTSAYSYFQDEIDSQVTNNNFSYEQDDVIDNLSELMVNLDSKGADTKLEEQSIFNDIEDYVINAEEEVSFSLIKKSQILGFDFSLIKVDNLPKGANLWNNIFSWTPTLTQTGEHQIKFYINNDDALTIDIYVLSNTGLTNNSVGDDSLSQFNSSNMGDKVNQVIYSNLPNLVKQVSRDRSLPPNMQSTNVNFKKTNTKIVSPSKSINRSLASPSVPAIVARRGMRVASPVPVRDNLDSVLPENFDFANDLIVKPQTPVLNEADNANFDGNIRLEWQSNEGYNFEIEESNSPNFDTVKTYWTTDLFLDISSYQHPESAYYYYRVKAWSTLPSNGGISSDSSNIRKICINYDKDINLMGFINKDLVTQTPLSTGNFYIENTDIGAYDEQVGIFSYDLSNQLFAGVSYSDNNVYTLDDINSLCIRLRGDMNTSFPNRVVLELKYKGEVQGTVLVSDIKDFYQDFIFPLYAKSNKIDEIVLVIDSLDEQFLTGKIYIDEFFLSSRSYQATLLPNLSKNAGISLSDEALLDKVQADTAKYFYDQTIGVGHVKDSLNGDFSSIAATGFGFSSLAIMASRYGSTNNWNYVTPEMAKRRAIAILDDLLEIQADQSLDSSLYGVDGFFYHFIDSNNIRYENSEVSVVDTALLVVGALTCGEYFGGEVKEKADLLYANINWESFLNIANYTYRMGWKPNRDRGFNIPFKGGFLSDATYTTSTDEVLLISLLALGSDVENELYQKSYFSYPRNSKTYIARTGENVGEEYTIVNSYFSSLFTYLYAHCYFDFKNLGDDSTYFAEDAPYPVSINWWDNSVNAIHANRQFCLDESENYPFSYNEFSWGISAVERPNGRYEGRYGAVPFDNGAANDGVVAFYSALSSLPFFDANDLSANEAFKVLRYYYDNFNAESYGVYGFYDSVDNRGNFSSNYLGVDQGPIVTMIENQRSGLIWNSLSQNEKIANALKLVYPKGFDWLNVDVKNINDNLDVGELIFGTHREGTNIVSAAQYAQVSFNFENPTAKLVIYTDNLNNPIPYTGEGDPAGMVGVSNSTMVAPLHWVVFDEIQSAGYSFENNALWAARIQDASVLGFSFEEEMLSARTIIDGFGNLASYPESNRMTDSSSVYLYFGCDFSGLRAQDYKTDTLTIEIYHE